jgi:3-oxoadipate enol-lactonase
MPVTIESFMSEMQVKASFEPRLNWVRTSTEKSETVVLIHAVGHDLTYWDRQIEALRIDYNVVAFDLPGHGSSTGLPEDWSFDYAAAIVAKLIEETSTSPVHLVGISFGGMIAQVTTLSRPELVRSLTLIGTASHFPNTARDAMRARAETVREGGMVAVVPSSLERWFTQKTRRQRPDIVDRITKTLLGDDPATHAAIWDVISHLDIRSRIGEVACPTLILVGEHDPSTPPSVAYELQNAITDAKITVIPDASHIVTVEVPAAVNDALIAFLNELKGKSL